LVEKRRKFELRFQYFCFISFCSFSQITSSTIPPLVAVQASAPSGIVTATSKFCVPFETVTRDAVPVEIPETVAEAVGSVAVPVMLAGMLPKDSEPTTSDVPAEPE
jgi:hypothetical protein